MSDSGEQGDRPSVPAGLPAAVLWDLDGTLIDTEPYWMACEHELVAQHGGVWTDDDAKAIVGFDLLTAAGVIRDRGRVQLSPAEIVDHLVAAVAERIRQHFPWRPGARELLADLGDAGVPCGLVTMSWRPIADEVLRHVPPGSFQTVVTGDTVLNGKPHPEPYRRAADELGVDPLSCVAIEDSPTGVASAEAAGCVVVAVPHIVPIPAAPNRVELPSLVGVTPQQLGEIVETTPPPSAHGTPSAIPRSSGPATPADRFADAILAVRARFAGRRRLAGALAAAFLLLVGSSVWWFGIRDTTEPFRPGAFRVHTWVPPWSLSGNESDFGSNVTLFQQVSPFWYEVTGVSTIGVLNNTPEDSTDQVVADARRHGIPVVASLFDQTSARSMAAIIADDNTRATHINAIVNFATDNEFDGLDINYERFAFDDGRDTWADTRPNWVTFIEELSARMRGEGLLLTVSVPPVYDGRRGPDSGYWVYDYGAIVDHVDAIRIMGYDFSTDSPGPIAPMDWLRDEVIPGAIEAAGGPEKLVLGIPLYGRNWVAATDGDCPDSAVGRQSPRLRAIDELIELRDATPVYNETFDEWSFTYELEVTEGDESCVQTREVHYPSIEGVRNRMQLSVDTGLLGISLFAFGYHTDEVFESIIEIDATLVTDPPEE